MSPTSFPVAKKLRKLGPLSVRNVALTAALPLSLLSAGRAEAISTISQTVSTTTFAAFNNQGFSFSTPRSSSAFISQDFDKFDSSLGTLVGIRFQGNGDLVGSFRGARSSTSTPLSSLTGGTGTLNVNFLEAGWSSSNTGGAIPFVGSSSLNFASSNSAIASAGTLLTSSNPNLTISGSDTAGTYFSSFEGAPGDVITATFTWGIQLSSNNLSASGTCGGTIKCTGFNFSPTGLTNGQTALRGDINEFTLFYDYEPAPEQVPAPLPILGSATAFAYTRRLRRRIQKARLSL
jgi:hypothetical protein